MTKSKYNDIKHRIRPLQRMRNYMLIFDELELITNSSGLLIVDKKSKMFDVWESYNKRNGRV